jgi:hypothetical protein
MSEIHWEEPPKVDTRGGRALREAWQTVADALRREPGRWALIATYPQRTKANNVATRIKLGQISAFAPAGSFEALYRTVDGECRVYARAVPEATDGR